MPREYDSSSMSELPGFVGLRLPWALLCVGEFVYKSRVHASLSWLVFVFVFFLSLTFLVESIDTLCMLKPARRRLPVILAAAISRWRSTTILWQNNSRWNEMSAISTPRHSRESREVLRKIGTADVFTRASFLSDALDCCQLSEGDA